MKFNKSFLAVAVLMASGALFAQESMTISAPVELSPGHFVITGTTPGTINSATESVIVVVPAPVKPVTINEKFTLNTVELFDFDKSDIRADSKRNLEEVLRQLSSINLETVAVIGHADSVGTASYNKKLALRRAEAIKTFLISNGVSADRVFTAGQGSYTPVADNKTEDGRAQNRHVEIEVIGARAVTYAAN